MGVIGAGLRVWSDCENQCACKFPLIKPIAPAKSSAEVHLGAVRGANPRCSAFHQAKGILGQGLSHLNQSRGGIELGPPIGMKDCAVSSQVSRLHLSLG